MLQHDDLPRNSWVYFIIVQYPLMRVKAPDGGADPQPDDVTRPEMVSPLFSSSYVNVTPPVSALSIHDLVILFHPKYLIFRQ